MSDPNDAENAPVYVDPLKELPAINVAPCSTYGRTDWGVEVGFNPLKTKQSDLTFTFHYMDINIAEQLVAELQVAIKDAKESNKPLSLFEADDE